MLIAKVVQIVADSNGCEQIAEVVQITAVAQLVGVVWISSIV